MIISVALPHIYLVTYETFSFPVCNRSQYHFPSNYNICSHRFFKCNWLGFVTAGRKAIASILSGAIYIQLCKLTHLLLLVLLCLPRKKSTPLLHGSIVFFFSNLRHQQQWLSQKMHGVAIFALLVTLKQCEQVLALSRSFTRWCFFFLMRDLKAVSIWFNPQQTIYAINCIQLLLPPLKSEQLRKRKKIRSYHNQPQLYNRHISLQS